MCVCILYCVVSVGPHVLCLKLGIPSILCESLMIVEETWSVVIVHWYTVCVHEIQLTNQVSS